MKAGRAPGGFQGGAAIFGLFGLFALLAACLVSCGDWVTLGSFTQCGAPCAPTTPLQCGRFGYKYNRAEECVCGSEVDCINFPCELPPERGCFIAGFDAQGACSCLALRKPGACGQPCDAEESCAGGVAEFNEHGACVCGRAACPCGQVCAADVNGDCQILRQYNEHGVCACAPVRCPACDGEPCCAELCGTECVLEACVDDGSGSCGGFCDKANKCVKGAQVCAEVP